MPLLGLGRFRQKSAPAAPLTEEGDAWHLGCSVEAKEARPMQNAVAAVPSVPVARAHDRRGAARAILFKVDHPRAIDRYIDYFGSPPGTVPAIDAPSSFERLTARTPA